VGFRPFVYTLAVRLGLTGWVSNDADGVHAEVQGAGPAIEQFVAALRSDAPPLAVVEAVESVAVPCQEDTGFRIAPSDGSGRPSTLVSPDVATCGDCLRELFDPNDRRYRYPFNNCTNCGPRYTIIQGVPYDRPSTTMAGFPMCGPCRIEYEDPTNRRFHAQPVACPVCGPRLSLPVETVVQRLLAGDIVAIKGLGGYHLAVDATQDAAVARLRQRKMREEKPFAVMVPDLATAEKLCHVTPADRRALLAAEAPIVLMASRGSLAPSVAPGNRSLGLFLPYTPLHHLLMRDVGRPLVMTSGNRTDEPIVYQDGDRRLDDIADVMLVHDRPIHIRTDDSIVRTFRDAPTVQRRARGFVPRAVRVPEGRLPGLAVGAELKNTICLLRGSHAFLSHHIGDLENHEAYRSFEQAIEHLQRLFDIELRWIAHDLHPEYLSTKWAQDRDLPLMGIQHHHAHIASCLADNGHPGPVIGIALDGLGFGTDGTIWGGEFLVADLRDFERRGWLSRVRMPGGAAAIKAPWRMALSWLEATFGQALPALPPVGQHPEQDLVLQAARQGINAPLTSSMGRLFDAVSAILGVREVISYEGQAAIELEQHADPDETGSYAVPLRDLDGGSFEVSGEDLIRHVVSDRLDGAPGPVVAARFHHAVADAILAGAERLKSLHGLSTVALSGGVFQNLRLLTGTVERLEAHGFTALCHRQVPCNDGGISLGQAVVASRRATGPAGPT
jgi:hydrogenase maturation protein HypF